MERVEMGRCLVKKHAAVNRAEGGGVYIVTQRRNVNVNTVLM